MRAVPCVRVCVSTLGDGFLCADGPARYPRIRQGSEAGASPGTPNQHTSLGVLYELVC